jgi:hypothetical protein
MGVCVQKVGLVELHHAQQLTIPHIVVCGASDFVAAKQVCMVQGVASFATMVQRGGVMGLCREILQTHIVEI